MLEQRRRERILLASYSLVFVSFCCCFFGGSCLFIFIFLFIFLFFVWLFGWLVGGLVWFLVYLLLRRLAPGHDILNSHKGSF